MKSEKKSVLSASRRTDIPAFYLDWFMKCIDQGYFEVINPYTKKIRTIDATPSMIHSIVFWSKNYAPFIQSNAGKTLLKKGYHLYFNFTVNSASDLLEPGTPDLKLRLNQMETLCNEHGSEAIAWRFDPICFYQSGNASEKNNLSDFETIAAHASKLGIKKCITSFFDPYKKIDLRLKKLCQTSGPTVTFNEPDIAKQKLILKKMTDSLDPYGISLFLCCEKQLFEALDLGTRISENACIDGKLLKRLYGGDPETKKDYGQRSKQGCGCTKSIDIGSYDLHPCQHNCLYCYANPQIDHPLKQGGA